MILRSDYLPSLTSYSTYHFNTLTIFNFSLLLHSCCFSYFAKAIVVALNLFAYYFSLHRCLTLVQSFLYWYLYSYLFYSSYCDTNFCGRLFLACEVYRKNMLFIFNYNIQSAKILLLPPKYEKIMVPSNHFFNIAIAILDFSLLLLVKLSLLIPFAAFLVSVLGFFFDGSLSKVIALLIAKKLPLLLANAFKSGKERQLLLAITIWEAIQKRSQEPIYKTHTKIEAKGLRATTLLSQS